MKKMAVSARVPSSLTASKYHQAYPPGRTWAYGFVIVDERRLTYHGRRAISDGHGDDEEKGAAAEDQERAAARAQGRQDQADGARRDRARRRCERGRCAAGQRARARRAGRRRRRQ